jgi:hypothetical protein
VLGRRASSGQGSYSFRPSHQAGNLPSWVSSASCKSEPVTGRLLRTKT